MEQITQQIHQIALFAAPFPWLRALLIIAFALILGKFADWIITAILSKLVSKTQTDFDDKILGLLHRPIFLSVLLVGLVFATYEFDLRENVTHVTVHILKTIGLLVWLRFGLRFMNVLIDQLDRNEERFHFITPTTNPLIKNTSAIVLVALAVYAVFLIWNINITAWIASAGIIGLAVSFAAKDTLSNVFGGVTIFADKPFEVGDFINLSTGERGMITKIGVRSTRILTRDDVEITVPNGILATTTVINESGGPSEKFRIRVEIGVAYGSDIDQVENVLLEIAGEHSDVCEIPKPRVRFRKFGDSSLDYELLCWVEKPVFRGKVQHELNRGIYKRFQTEKIEIPFPQRDIHIKEAPPVSGKE
ncbi:MAG: mechanosensitive ion channel family protein [Pyrinomonadaceae bacterium]